VFGRPSAPGDFKYQTPELLGSQRTGPDLTNIGTRQPSDVWQYIHLYQPRAVVLESVMPSFSWMFSIVETASPGVVPVPLPASYAPAHGVVIPTHDAQALIAYLASLKQPPLAIAAMGGSEPGAAGTANPKVDGAPMSSPAGVDGYDPAKGGALFTANCSACHQASGEGLPGAFPPLKGNDVVNDDDPTMHIQVVLNGLHDAKVGGVAYGSAMPPFAATLSDADISNIVNYERSSWGNHAKAVTAAQVITERAKTK
jgi:cytochrome c oxidase cbb3-type subunit 2